MPGINDGLGFEEVNKEVTFTEIISGTDVYGHDLYGEVIHGGIISGTNIWSERSDSVTVSGDVVYGMIATFQNLYVDLGLSGVGFRDTSDGGRIRSASIENSAELFGYRVKAGSVLMGDSISGLVSFKTPFANANYFMTMNAREYNAPQFSRTGSQSIYCGSGLRRASGCWIIGGSATVVDWIAVGV